jgi:hypothetical protein
MKKAIFLIILAALSNSTFCQNAYYDAQFLTTLSIKDLNRILTVTDSMSQPGTRAKIPPAINLSEHEKAVIGDYILFLQNPFNPSISNLDLSALKSSIDKYNRAYTNGSIPTKAFVGEVGALSLISSVIAGNFSLSADQQTKIIDGLSKYYAEEFRKAQLLSYMQTFESTIGNIGELQVLLPKTYAKLKSADPSRFPELGDEYKTIFNEDLKSIIDNLINHIDNYSGGSSEPKLKWLNTTNIATIKKNEYYDCFKISADIGSKLINNYHPVDLFNYVDNKYYDPILLSKANRQSADYIKLILHGINLIQKNVLDTTRAKGSQFANAWLSLQDLKKLNTKDEWLFFAGLMYQQDKDFFNTFIFNGAGKNLSNVTDTEISTLKTKINSILSTLIEIQDFRSNLKEENLKDNFSGYMNLILKEIEITNYFTTTQFPATDLKKYLLIADYTMNIYDNARKKDYNNTIYYTVEILNQFLVSNSTYLQVANTIEQYGAFMTDVINAKNSDEVKDVIKKHAAPPTSFILKREYKRTLSITGQPGYFASIEKFDGSNQNFKFVSGITLPIGFEVSFKLKAGEENSGSLGFFAQIIDLGAVLNFRVGDSTSTLPDKIEFKQIFSPGGSINYGFKNSPITLGIGYQYSPQLRKITLNGSDIYPNGHRLFLRLAWDIPLMNIAKSKTK